ncbi:MAG TPA: CHRD domain-containing protein [Thermoanaerobaculia bacterium]|nr:CHRD domain-containing protein [Thermoanaerobaculia bacterium]
MKRRALFVSSLVLLFCAASVSAQTLGAVLTPSQETPACSGTGFGNATVTFDSTRQNVNATITVANLNSPITGFHIHEAPLGQAGNIILNFQGLGGTFSNGKMTGTFPIAADVAQRMLQNPSNFYVNVHTSQCPGGAARGQLAFANGGPVMYFADLRGSNETPPNSSTAFGAGLVTFDPFNNTMAFDVATNGIASPTASHIHSGASGGAGGVLINFATGPSGFTNGRVAGFGPLSGSMVTSSLQPSDLTNLATATTAANYYVNVHSTAFPGGEIRGQLAPAQEFDIPVAGHVTNGIGQTFISDVRIFNPSFTSSADALVEFFQAGTSPNTTPTTSMVVSLPVRGTSVLNDIAGSSGLNITGVGAIRITSAVPVIATSRIFVNSNNGSFGQFVPAFSRSQALQHGAMPQVSNTSAANGFRSNLGFFNPDVNPVTVRIEARDAAGNSLGSNTITLQPLTQQQNGLATYFPGIDLSNTANATVTFDASAPIFVYVSEVDNTSGDSFLVPAQSDPGVAANQ